jgi:hypothetical protein
MDSDVDIDDVGIDVDVMADGIAAVPLGDVALRQPPASNSRLSSA